MFALLYEEMFSSRQHLYETQGMWILTAWGRPEQYSCYRLELSIARGRALLTLGEGCRCINDDTQPSPVLCCHAG